MSHDIVLCKDGKTPFVSPKRLGHGIEPSCVQHCVGGALRYVTREDVEEITKGKHASFIGKVCYASSKWKLAQWREIG